MVTDYVLAAVACILAHGIVRANDSCAARLWALGFAVAGAAALAGGSVHGFGFAMPGELAHGLRVGAMMGIGIISASLLAGAVMACVRPGVLRRLLLVLCATQVVFYLGWMVLHPNFRYAAYDSLAAAALLLVFLVVWRVRGGPPGTMLGIVGLCLSLVGAVLQQAGVGLHPVWFNHNDLYHVIQTAALWLIAQPARTLRDAT
jgi:hypothetical protein